MLGCVGTSCVYRSRPSFLSVMQLYQVARRSLWYRGPTSDAGTGQVPAVSQASREDQFRARSHRVHFLALTVCDTLSSFGLDSSSWFGLMT